VKEWEKGKGGNGRDCEWEGKQEEKEGNSLKAAELTLHVAARHTILYAVMK